MDRSDKAPLALDAYRTPFTANRRFKPRPRFTRAAGMYDDAETRREVLDASSGLWCVDAGHRR